MKTIDKPCEICGEMMHNVTDRRRYCDNCYKGKQKDYYEKCISRKKEKAKEKKENNLTETAKKAREKGLSYGKYVALYGG